MATLQETHFALVTDNNDPEQRCRLKVRCQSLTGADHQLPDWIEAEHPVFTSNDGGGAAWVPTVGSTVELVVDVHDTEFDQIRNERFLANPSARWRPAGHTASSGAEPLPDALKTNYPDRRGFVTPSGHKLFLDDRDGKIVVEDKWGNRIELSQTAITLTVTTGALVHLGRQSGTEDFVALAGRVLTELSAIVTGFNAHTHPHGDPTTGPPSAPLAAPASVAAANTQAD